MLTIPDIINIHLVYYTWIMCSSYLPHKGLLKYTLVSHLNDIQLIKTAPTVPQSSDLHDKFGYCI